MFGDFNVLTLIAEDATPVRVADALPCAAIAVAMPATRIYGAIVAQRSLPARSTAANISKV